MATRPATQPPSQKLFESTWFHILDSGGQQQFADILPAFVCGNTLHIILVKLTEKLSDIPKFSFYVNGRPVGVPQELCLTNLQQIIQTVRSQASTTPTVIEGAESSSTSRPYFMIVGTFADHLTGIRSYSVNSYESLEDKNRQLISALAEFKDQLVFRNKSLGQLIFPIDNTVRRKRKQVISEIRQRIVALKECQVKIKLPIRWFLFELEVSKEGEQTTHGKVSLDKCTEIGSVLGMSKSDVISCLTYLHKMTLFLYFHHILPNVVFTKPQHLLDLVSNIFSVAFISEAEAIAALRKPLPVGAQRKLRREGIFSADILDCFDMQFIDGLFRKPEFLKLLEELRIIVLVELVVGEMLYFAPILLPTKVLTEKEKQHFSQTCSALYVVFDSGVIPKVWAIHMYREVMQACHVLDPLSLPRTAVGQARQAICLSVCLYVRVRQKCRTNMYDLGH